MFCAASVAPPAVADGDLPMLAFLSFPVSSLLMCAAAIRRTGFFVFHGIPNPAFSALPTLCFHHFLIIFDFSTSAVPPAGAWFAPFSSAARVQPRGCKGRSPLHKNNLKSPPSPPGKGAGGIGGRKEGKGRADRRQRMQATRRARGLPPFPVPPGFSPRGCKGRSPLHEITLGSPFPPGRGSGGWGQKSKLKSGAAGNPKGKPPAGAWFAPFSSAARVQPRGCKGRSPLHEITFGSPFPPGRGPGDGGRKEGKGRGAAGGKEGTPPGHLHGRNCTCRKRSNTGVPGAKPPAK